MSNNAAAVPSTVDPRESGPDNDPERESVKQDAQVAPQPLPLPQKFSAPPRRNMPRPRTPAPIRPISDRTAHVGPVDPNPRRGSMHNVGPPLRGPPFPMTRAPIYFPSSLIRNRATSQAFTKTDISSPPMGAKCLQKGTPQRDWKHLMACSTSEDKRNENPRATAVADHLAQHIQAFEARRANFKPPRSRETAPRYRVEKPPFRPRRMHTVPEENESPNARPNAFAHPSLRYQPPDYRDARPQLQRDVSAGEHFHPQSEQQEQPTLLSNASEAPPTMTINDPITHSHLFQADSTPFAHQDQQVSFQHVFPTTGPAAVQEPAEPYGDTNEQVVARDADYDVIMSDADELPQAPDAHQIAADHQHAPSLPEVAMTDAPDTAAEKECVPDPPAEQPSRRSPFDSIWVEALANHKSGLPMFSNRHTSPVPEPFAVQSAASNQPSTPLPRTSPFPSTMPTQPLDLHSPGRFSTVVPPTPEAPAVPSVLHASQQVAFNSTAAQHNKDDEDVFMFNAETPLLVRKRRIDQVDDPEQIEHAWSQPPTPASPLISMSDADEEDVLMNDDQLSIQNAPIYTPEPLPVPASPRRTQTTDGVMPGAFPATPIREGRGSDVPMAETVIRPSQHVVAQSSWRLAVPGLIAGALCYFGDLWQKLWRLVPQAASGVYSTISATPKKASKVFMSVKRRAVEFCRSRSSSSTTASRRQRRRSSRAQRQEEYLRSLSPEQRRQEKSRQLRAERRSQSTHRVRRAGDRSDETPRERPDVQMSDTIAPPTTSHRVVTETTPREEPLQARRVLPQQNERPARSSFPVRPFGTTRAGYERMRQMNEEIERQWSMPAEEYFRLERLRTGIDYDREAPPIGPRHTSPVPCSQPESAPVPAAAPPEAPAPEEQLQEEPYEGYTQSPEQASSALSADWSAAESFPREARTPGQDVDNEAQHPPSPRCSDGPVIRPLSATWGSRVQSAMASPENRQLATTLRGDALTRRDLATCCTPTAWLNDEVINAYLGHVVNYARHRAGNNGRHDLPKYHAFNSFFYSNLRDKGYESVRRWASRAKIGGPALLQVDAVFVPIHDHAHWTLMVVKPTARTIEHFDSLGQPSRAHAARVKTWLRGELGDLFKEEDWRLLPAISPQQNNGSDCGVFLLTTAKLVALDLPLKYGAKDIPEIRKRIAAELINGGFEGDFDPESEFPTKSML